MDDAPIPDPESPALAPDHEPHRLAFVPPRGPEPGGAWLHVVTGPNVPAASRGVFELAARFLAAGQRVLVVDGAPRLRLHERFDRAAGAGLREYLEGETPVLDLVQDSGRLGLYLMAHGTPATPPAWEELGPALERAKPYFGRVILALDAEAPAAIGAALAGRRTAGWWSHEGRGTPGYDVASRLGIQCDELDLEEMLMPTLEALENRLWALVTAGRTSDAPGLAAAPAAPAVPEPPAPVESDAAVRERLRFLLWTRRVESEARAPEPAAAPEPAPDPSAEPRP